MNGLKATSTLGPLFTLQQTCPGWLARPLPANGRHQVRRCKMNVPSLALHLHEVEPTPNREIVVGLEHACTRPIMQDVLGRRHIRFAGSKT